MEVEPTVDQSVGIPKGWRALADYLIAATADVSGYELAALDVGPAGHRPSVPPGLTAWSRRYGRWTSSPGC